MATGTLEPPKDPKELRKFLLRNGHCTSIIKVTEDFSELFFGHTTWQEYSTMLRVYKTYDFPIPGTRSRSLHFSSYPGQLSSIDDFFTLDSGLVTIETTIQNLNPLLAKKITPNNVLYWLRIFAANRLATSPEHWTQIFAMYNSGTYNNQWMVINVTAFVPNQPLPTGLFWVLEQMPGTVIAADQTATLAYGYWPSYNVPAYPAIYQMADYPLAAKALPSMMSYQTCARANILRRNQTQVQDFAAYRHLLRFNSWEHDPLSLHDSILSVSARGDMDPKAPSCFGGTDTKASSASLFRQGRRVFAQSGPTHDEQPAFSYATTRAKCDHREGQPTEWNFPWIELVP
eukprot:TRINITY_DN14827_c0_g1_i2.p1 TRINITY_DN14827_c0_g1~~TRINITY_DN14827_c0_g1_i2.p1  ORF type:complete len:344 (-),score=51.98 TRINITY_DN14827_c0_g1_i2:3-1034(-)